MNNSKMKAAVKNPALFTKELNDWYLDYFNNYLTVSVFAEHNSIDEDTAKQVLELGKAVNWDASLRGRVL